MTVLFVILVVLTIEMTVEWSWTCRKCKAHFEHGTLLDVLNPFCPSCKKDRYDTTHNR